MTIYGFLWRYFGWALSAGMIAGDLTSRGQDQSTGTTQLLGWGMLALWIITTLAWLNQWAEEQRGYPSRDSDPPPPTPRSWTVQRGQIPKIGTESAPESELEPAPDLRHKI